MYTDVKIHTLPKPPRVSGGSPSPPLPALGGIRAALPYPFPARRRRCALADILKLRNGRSRRARSAILRLE